MPTARLNSSWASLSEAGVALQDLRTTFGIPSRGIDAQVGSGSPTVCPGRRPGAVPYGRVHHLDVPDFKAASVRIDPSRAADFGPQLLHHEAHRFQDRGLRCPLRPAHVAADKLKPFGRSA